MIFKARRYLTAVLVLSLLMLMHVAESGYAAWRPKIAFSSTRDGNSEIYVMDIDGRHHVRLTANPARDYDPSWCPNGDRIAFVSDRDNGVDQIYVMHSDGRVLMGLTKESTHIEPAWSPNGEKIVYVRNQGRRQVWVMDADGGNQARLTQIGQNAHPAWSPDGERIAFVSVRDGVTNIYVMDKNGNNHERLTQNMVPGHPSWSPDSKWIAYESIDEESRFQIFVVKTDGSGLSKRLTLDPPDKWRPAWSPDGDTIAYVSVEPFPLQKETIHLMTSNGKHLKELSEEHKGSDKDPDWFDPVGRAVSPAGNVVTIWGAIKKPVEELLGR